MSDVLDFIDDKQSNQKEILEFLNEWLLSYPEIENKIRYKIPFYFRQSWICYLNPIKEDGIEVVFLRGNELSNDQNLLDFKNRKQVAGLSIYDVKAIPTELLGEVLEEALLLDETIPYAAKRKSKQ